MKKEMIEINKDATVEFALFKKFTEFLYDLDIKRIREELIESYNEKSDIKLTETNLYYFYVGLKLLNGLKVGPTKNYFVETTSSADIPKDRFIFFCDKFVMDFAALSLDDQKRFGAINLAFIQWRNGFYQKEGWELPISKVINPRAQKEAIDLSENKDDKEKLSDIEYPVVTNENLLEATSVIFEYYETGDRVFELQSEYNLAELFINFVKQRKEIDYNIKVIQSQKDNFSSNFTFAGWEIYELYGSKVTCRSLEFNPLKNDQTDRFPGFSHSISLGRKKKLDTYKEDYNSFDSIPPNHLYDYFEYDYLHDKILISNCYFERNDELLKSYNIENYSFSFQGGYPIIHTGHKCSLDSNDILTCIPAFLVSNIHSTQRETPYYIEYDINSDEIPRIVKSLMFGWKDLHLYAYQDIYLTIYYTLNHKDYYPIGIT